MEHFLIGRCYDICSSNCGNITTMLLSNTVLKCKPFQKKQFNDDLVILGTYKLVIWMCFPFSNSLPLSTFQEVEHPIQHHPAFHVYTYQNIYH